MKKIWTGLFAGATLSVLGACLLPVGDGEGLTKTGDLPATDTNVTFAQVQEIFNASCTNCHKPGSQGYIGTGGAPNGLDLSTGASYASLVNKATFQQPTVHPVYRVRPGSPDSSYLYMKIIDGTRKQGGRMPAGGADPLSDQDIETIRRWIAKGALNDQP